MRLWTTLNHLRFRPFDTSTDDGRASERYRRALWSILAEVLARSGSMSLMVLSISWTTPYLGAERFGAWAAMSSLAMMLSFLDLGLANAMTNRVANAMRTGSTDAASQVVSGGMLLLTGLALVQGLALVVLAHTLSWRDILGLQTPAAEDEIRHAAQVFALIFSGTLIGNGITRTFHGLQRAYLAHGASFLGSLIALVAMFFATRNKATVPTLVLCQMAPPTLAVLMLVGPLIKWRLINPLKAMESAKQELRPLIATAGLFLLLQMGTTIGWNSDHLVLAGIAGSVSVAAFSVTQRLFQFITQPLAIMNAPLWGAYADAQSHHDLGFIRKTFTRSMLATGALATLGGVFCMLAGQEIVRAWTSGSLETSLALLGALATWALLESTGNALAMLLNGLNVVRQQVWTAALFIALAIPSKVYMSGQWGATGLVWANVISFTLALGIGYGMIFRRDIEARLGSRRPSEKSGNQRH